MTTWAAFAAAEPELADFSARRLRSELPSYLATVQGGGTPRIHPVTPIFTDQGLYLFMEPTSPKGRDLRERPWFALHSGVPDHKGTGGEVWVTGTARPDDDPGVRAAVTAAAGYDPPARYVVFELQPTEVRCFGYGDVALPEHPRWRERAANPSTA